MRLNLALATLILALQLLVGCTGRYDAVNPAVVTVCADGSAPIFEHSKGMTLCPR